MANHGANPNEVTVPQHDETPVEDAVTQVLVEDVSIDGMCGVY